MAGELFLEPKRYPIMIGGELREMTMTELRTELTPDAYELYWKVYRQRGTVTFGDGCYINFLKNNE